MNRLFLKVLNKFRLLDSIKVSGSIVLNKRKFKIPIIYKTGFANMFMSEQWMIDLLKIILTDDKKCFVDVGVNVGQTLLKLRSVSRVINYIGFEPNPLCVLYVNDLIKVNRFENCHLIPVGISDLTKIGVLNYFDDSATDGAASIISNFRPNKTILRKEYVPVFTIEDLKNEVDFSEISVLKIDVEGAELEVLKSFFSIIEQSKPVILIEILPVYSEANISRIERQNEIMDIIKRIEYIVYRVIKTGDRLLGFERISTIGIHSDLNQCEYVLVFKEQIEPFENFNYFSATHNE